MIDRQRIETVVKSNVGELVSAVLKDETWQCHLRIPKNVDARLRSLKNTFPGMKVVQRDGAHVYVTIPITKTPRPRAAPQTALAGLPNLMLPKLMITPEAREMLLMRLTELYEAFFEEPGEVMRLDAHHFRLTFAGDMTYPFSHPFMAVLSSLLPDLKPVAISTEHFGAQKRTSIYLSTTDEPTKGPGHGIAIFIDGSHRDGVGAYGACYYRKGHPTGYLVGAVNGVDSNGAELMALLQALAHLDDTAQNITLYTDSTYVQTWANDAGRAWMERAINRHISLDLRLIKRDGNPSAHQLAYKFLTRLFT